jgi:hypothetical protein
MQLLRNDGTELCLLRNEASLNFVSLRSQLDSVGRRGPSRIKMNALRAPLTALYASNGRTTVFFLLTPPTLS